LLENAEKFNGCVKKYLNIDEICGCGISRQNNHEKLFFK